MGENVQHTDLILRFIQKNATDEEIEQLKQWVNASSENRKLFDQYNESWQYGGINNFNAELGWSKMQRRVAGHKQSTKVRRFQGTLLWKVAASVAVLIAMSVSGLYIAEKIGATDLAYVVEAPRGEKSKVTLSDGSIVWLNSGTTLAYGSVTDKREVELSGEAFFEVTKSKKPFTVKMGDSQVKVYGTQFNVCAYNDDDFIEATLEEGSIAFKRSERYNEIKLEPGQQLVYNKTTGKIRKLLVNTSIYSAWKENMLKFDNAPFEEVVKKLERWYDVDVVLDPDFKEENRFTLTIKTESLREMLEYLSFTTSMRSEIKEDKVYIYSK
ncbi:DUF4974 domain-containing protein [Puteibacter caeruleilacunae]|nr:DUF4974 domain-containing protein [Puteibacter caeruleilacunae]